MATAASPVWPNSSSSCLGGGGEAGGGEAGGGMGGRSGKGGGGGKGGEGGEGGSGGLPIACCSFLCQLRTPPGSACARMASTATSSSS
jgi:hypothetical protein